MPLSLLQKPVIHCFNPNCQAANADSHTVCQRCNWPLVHRFLWAVGPGADQLSPGTLLAGRYRVIQSQILLDIHPSRSPVSLEDVPAEALPYLYLSPYLRTIPRPFALVESPTGSGSLLLLEEVPVETAPDPAQSPRLLPSLTEAWPSASTSHQISWLWQIAQLWEPLQGQKAIASLLHQDLVRVDGADLRLLALEVDLAETSVALVALGQQWQELISDAQPPLRPYLEALIQGLLQGAFTPNSLQQSLLQALEELTAPAQRLVQFATYTDKGPTRQRNEDACYPPSGTVGESSVVAAQVNVGNPAPLLLVCDGIGGHQGGDVASRMAIETVTENLQPFLTTPNLSHTTLMTALGQAVLQANQTLSEQNDQAHRQARDRMGTTLVIAVVYGARLYLAHLGDSRAYQIRPGGCRQITLDDDVASREVRLGHSFYHDALLGPGSGSLVQAIGMADSQYLYPTVQMQVLAEDSLVLICSDGLSDNDLVVRLWTQELLPVLQGSPSVEIAGQRLVQLANTHNGHDNITLGLLRMTVPPAETLPTLEATLAIPKVETTLPESRRVALSAQPAPRTKPRLRLLPLLLSGIVVTALGAGATLALWNWGQPRLRQSASTPNGEGQPLSPAAAPPGTPAGVNDLAVGEVLQVGSQPPVSPSQSGRLTLVPEIPAVPPPDVLTQPALVLPVGSTIQIVSRQKEPDNQLWVRLKVCSIPSGESSSGASLGEPSSIGVANQLGENLPSGEGQGPISQGDNGLRLAQPGDEGWILEPTVQPTVQRLTPQDGTPNACP